MLTDTSKEAIRLVKIQTHHRIPFADRVEFLAKLEALLVQIESENYDAGMSDGESEGHSAGYSEGCDVGRSEGYDDGLEDGRSEGYDDGYTEGESAGIAACEG